MVSEPKFDL